MKTKRSLLLFVVFYFFLCQEGQSQDILWMKSFGGSSKDLISTSTIDHHGNIYICGAFRDSIDVDPGEGEQIFVSSHYYDTYVVKLNSDGELIHAHSIGGIAGDFPLVISVDENLNYYVSGTFDNTIDIDPGPDTLIFPAFNDHDIFFQKFNEANQLQWAFRLETPTDDDELRDIAIDKEGNVYCIGSFYYTMDFNPGESVYELTSSGREDIFILKLDPNGNFLWAKSIGGWYEDYGAQIVVDRLGGLLIAGSFRGSVDFDPGPDSTILVSTGVSDAFLLSLTSDGDFKSAKSFGGIANVYIRFIQFDNENNIVIGGSFRVEADFDPDPDEEYIVEGGSLNDLFVLKLDMNGDFMWVRTLGGGFSVVFIQPFDIDSLNNIYFGSSFSEPLDIISGDSTYVIDPVGEDDFFIEKINANGNFESAIIMGSAYFEYLNTVMLDKMANIFAIGIFRGDPEYQLNTTSASLSSVGSDDVFIQKLKQNIDSSNSIVEFPGFEISVYPNPNAGNFFLQTMDLIPGTYQVKIVNWTGQTVFEKEIRHSGSFQEEINLDENGSYLIEISGDNSLRIVKKVIVSHL